MPVSFDQLSPTLVSAYTSRRQQALVQGIAMLNLGSTQVGMILLWGLFFYDIFWVFFTPVMVTVAKNIDGPIKLLFPATMEWKNFNMLGLGDIVIPGMLEWF